MPDITIPKVTDPAKMVTDTVLLNHLSAQGVDNEYVEFAQDYAPFVKGVSSPYMKVYKDRLSDKKFAVFSGLPMVNADGVMVEVGWNFDGTAYTSKVNQFQAEVKDKTITITLINDQPDGRKSGDKLTYTPSLFLDGKEIIPSKSILHAVDPINENYLGNVLEWDYGICKRWLRLIEGKILGTWRFAENPKGEVRVKYNQVGDFKLNLSSFAINEDEELIKPEEFENPHHGYPFTIGDTATFNPDAHPESTTVDGEAYVGVSDALWAAKHDAANADFVTPSAVDTYAEITAPGSTGYFFYLGRSYFLFSISLPASATKTAATLSLYGSAKGDTYPWGIASNIYSGVPTDNNDIVVADYNKAKFGYGASAYSTAITYANWLIGSPFWNDFALNAAGLANIPLSGVAKFGWRESVYDAVSDAGTAPATSASTQYAGYFAAYTADKGAGYKPKLVVTYSEPYIYRSSRSYYPHILAH